MSETKQNNLIVRCPKCGREYHLCEIAMPGELLGKPKRNGVIKDPLGKILYMDWEDEPVQQFQYECDDCGKAFVVEAKITLAVSEPAEEEDFTEDSVSLL